MAIYEHTEQGGRKYRHVTLGRVLKGDMGTQTLSTGWGIASWRQPHCYLDSQSLSSWTANVLCSPYPASLTLRLSRLQHSPRETTSLRFSCRKRYRLTYRSRHGRHWPAIWPTGSSSTTLPSEMLKPHRPGCWTAQPGLDLLNSRANVWSTRGYRTIDLSIWSDGDTRMLERQKRK